MYKLLPLRIDADFACICQNPYISLSSAFAQGFVGICLHSGNVSLPHISSPPLPLKVPPTWFGIPEMSLKNAWKQETSIDRKCSRFRMRFPVCSHFVIKRNLHSSIKSNSFTFCTFCVFVSVFQAYLGIAKSFSGPSPFLYPTSKIFRVLSRLFLHLRTYLVLIGHCQVSFCTSCIRVVYIAEVFWVLARFLHQHGTESRQVYCGRF